MVHSETPRARVKSESEGPPAGAGTHRAALEVLRDCVDGLLCLSFAPPNADGAETEKQMVSPGVT